MKRGLKSMGRLVGVFFIVVLTACGGGGGGGGNPEEPLTTSTPSDLDWTVPQTIPENICTLSTGEEISSEIIAISVKDSVNKEAVEDIASGINGTIIGELPDIKAYYIKFDSPKMGIEIESIIDQLRLNPNIETASPEYIYEINEPFPSITDIETPGLLTDDQKWGFTRINMPQAWDAIRSSGKELANVIVAVIDTGVDLTHPDLENNLALEVNGYKAWDFGDNDQDVSYDSLSLCLKGDHGTKISGIIASIINGEGINGVSPTAKLFPLKYWPSIWKTSWDCEEGKKKVPAYAVAYAVYWAVLAEVDVINLSLGRYLDPNEYKQTVEYKVIKKALERDIIVVAAAGNDGKDASNFFPSALDGVISVGATDNNDERSIWSASSSSNYSDFPNSLWVAAPGTDVYTTDITTFLNYEYVNGTSIATPFVSGLAAFIKQVNPSLTNIEIADTIRNTASDVSVTYPDESNHTWKMINAFKAVTTILEEMGGNTLPTVTITSPSDGSIFTEGDEITFTGTGTDTEDGELTGSCLVWTSDKDGQIGTGQSFSISTLSVNAHTITLTATDYNGATGTDSITIIIDSSALTESPWPMFQHDAQHTGQSQYSGPQTGNLKWAKCVGDIYNPPLIGPDGTIYITEYNYTSVNDSFKAYDSDGNLKWEFIPEGYSSGVEFEECPVIGSDGTIYISSIGGLYAINPDGTLKWNKQPGAAGTDLTIGDDDTIYFGYRWGSYGGVYAVDSNGNQKWFYEIGYGVEQSPAVGLDGTVYAGKTNSGQGDGSLIAIDSNGNFKWEYTVGVTPLTPPMVGSDGTIYIGTFWDFYAVNTDGTLKWEYDTGGDYYDFASPAIGPDGTIYIGFNGKLHAIDPAVTLKWAFDLPSLSTTFEPDTLSVDKEGIIYVGTRDSLLAINADGTLKWEYEDSYSHFFSPVIGAEGRLYVGVGVSSLWAFGD